MLRNLGGIIAVCCILYLTCQLTASSAEDAQPSAEAPKKRPKFNETRIKEFFFQGEVSWNRTRKDDDKRPSYALLHAHMTCGSNRTNIKEFITSLMTQEYWPNVYYKNGQDAEPFLYIFTQEKKYAHRIDVGNKSSDEIKDVLRSYGFNGYPDPPEEGAETESSSKKTEL